MPGASGQYGGVEGFDGKENRALDGNEGFGGGRLKKVFHLCHLHARKGVFYFFYFKFFSFRCWIHG